MKHQDEYVFLCRYCGETVKSDYVKCPRCGNERTYRDEVGIIRRDGVEWLPVPQPQSINWVPPFMWGCPHFCNGHVGGINETD